MSSDMATAESYLLQHAVLSDFWILRTNHMLPGLIHYFDTEGRAFVLMDDDDSRVERCVELLEASGCPVFDDVTAMDRYIETRASSSA